MHADLDAERLAMLQTDEGRSLLAQAAELIHDGRPELQVISLLRRGAAADLVVAAITTVRLRDRAEQKFGADAPMMFFTAAALEQASRAEVAAHRAQRLVRLGVTRVVDAGCGLGADSIAFARAGITVRAVERDPVVFAALTANVSALGLGGSIEAIHADAESVVAEAEPGWTVYFDPSRRDDSGRIFDPERSSPALSVLRACAERGSDVVAKMSPTIDHRDLPVGWEAEWTSTSTAGGRSVVECCLSSPRLASVQRRATVLPSGADLTGHPDHDLPVGPSGLYLYEPDGAVIRAQLIGALIARYGGRLLDRHIAYVAADQPVSSALLSTYEVLESFPWSKRATIAALRRRAPRDLTIKKRGAAIEPMSLRKEMLAAIKQRHAEPLTLVIYRVGERTDVAITRPLGQSTA